MTEAVDISFYVGAQAVESAGNLDVPLSNGQIVSINLVEELPDDPNELVSFLESENCSRKYWITVASAYAQLGKLNEALEIVKSALNLTHFSDEDNKSFHSFLVWLYFKFVSNGVDKESYLLKASSEINSLAQRIKTDNSTSTTNSTSNLLSQAVLLLFNGRDDDALDIFEKILRIDQNNCFAILGKAQAVLNKTKNYTVALKLYQQVLILNPVMKPDPRIGIGICFWFLKDDKMALQAWQRALEIDPQNIKAKVLLNLANFHKAFTASLGDDEFLQNYKACLQDLAKNHKSSPNDSSILLALASYYFSKENYELVSKIISKIVSNITGDDNLANFTRFNSFNKISKFQSNVLSQCAAWLGRVELVKGDFLQSSKYFQEAIKFNETNLLAKIGLGQSQYNRGSIEEAIITYEKILRGNVKCLEANYALGLLYAQQKSRRKREAAIQILERYLRLSTNGGLASSNSHSDEAGSDFLNKEPITLNAYLVLSKLYEATDINQSLNYLHRAIESRKLIKKDVPLEVYNNIGVFNFLKQNYDEAATNFQTASEIVQNTPDFKSEDGDTLIDLASDLNVTLTYNLARAKEVSNESEAIEIYESLLTTCPHYFSAKIRLLFLDSISTNKSTKEEIKNEIEELLSLNASDLEIRSFYGWFVKNFGKKLGLKPDADTNHQKDTLVEYDSHDSYALISLANIYCILARDVKSSGSDDKRKKYYIRAVELFAKVLSVDPKNVYAAQGLAIAYIENKEPIKGLDILRKIRDSLNDISIYLNLGHVLIESKQYGKAIENYELALSRFTDGNDSKILSFLGRAWYLRAGAEKNLNYFKKAVDYTQRALELTTGSSSSIRFNLAYLYFQVAEFITRQPLGQRDISEIEKAIVDLQTAVEILNELSSDEEAHPPYPKAELKARANLGTTTLLNRLNATLDETKESIAQIEEKIEEARRLRKEEEEAKLKIENERLAAIKLREEELAKERAILQEQAKQWAEESRMNVVVEEDDDDKLFDEESNANSGEKKRKKKSGANPSKPKAKKRSRKKIVDSDEEEEEASATDSDVEAKPSSKKRAAEDDSKSRKKKKNTLSNEFIDDSDEELEDDLFNDKDEDTPEPEDQNGSTEANGNGTHNDDKEENKEEEDDE
ncbi:protein required for normal CLN1 and CLN2 G1 cyclin expression [Scheffersomyces xylosifermentans]|uniref:protein required for normal CLN1 and CLN2 G1 cyclin expression n=1 Tax=Scheffersomyces xylosifermentans TaxID=1304137 RepID=UPI00315C7720